jgi:hypothetical protein
MSAQAILIKSSFDVRKMATAVTNALNGAAKSAKIDFKVTTATWKTEVEFTIENASPYIRRIFTKNRIYLFVCFGTKAHIIRPKRGKFLAFSPGGRAKTRVGAVRSNKGSKGKGTTVFAREVRHPGTKARDFDIVIQAKWQQQLPIIIQRAIDSTLNKG